AAVLGHFDLQAGNAGAGERIGIGATPELAVGDDLQTDVFLQLDHAGDSLVFDFPQRLAIEFAGRVPLACAQEFGWARKGGGRIIRARLVGASLEALARSRSLVGLRGSR